MTCRRLCADLETIVIIHHIKHSVVRNLTDDIAAILLCDLECISALSCDMVVIINHSGGLEITVIDSRGVRHGYLIVCKEQIRLS